MDNNENEKLSIIVPVYNVEAYIERCLESILAQTYSELEVICVNDGSTDTSGEKCEEYKKKDGRVKVYHLDNHGVSYARNYGLSVMEGDWFCFVDSDDWLEPNYLEKMYEMAIRNHCDVAACGLEKTYEYKMGTNGYIEQQFVFSSKKECIHNFICNKNSMQGVSTNKLYRTFKFRDVRFDTKQKLNEDCLYVYEIMSRCDKACLTTLPLYHWYVRPDSACHKKKRVVDFSAANVFLILYDKTKKENDEEIAKTLQMNYISAVVQVLLYAKYDKTNAEVAEAKERCKYWKRNVWNMFNIKSKLKYVYAIYFSHLLGQEKQKKQ